MQGKYRKCEITSFKSIKVMGTTSPDRNSMWGEYTKFDMIKNRADPPVKEIELDIATNDYIENFGLSEFNSQNLSTSLADETCDPEYRHLPGVWVRTKRIPEDMLAMKRAQREIAIKNYLSQPDDDLDQDITKLKKKLAEQQKKKEIALLKKQLADEEAATNQIEQMNLGQVAGSNNNQVAD